MVSDQVNIFDLAKQLGKADLADAGQQAIQGNSVFIEYDNEITGRPSWLFCEPIETTGWSLCGVFDKEELPLDIDKLRQELMHIWLSAFCMFILLILFFFSLFPVTPPSLWITSFAISFALTLTISIFWYIAALYPDYKEDVAAIRNKGMLFSFMQETEQSNQNKTTDKSKSDNHKPLSAEEYRQLTYQYVSPTHVPTGVYINTIQFKQENKIEVVCYIWQRYVDGIHDNLSRGFILPQAAAITTDEIYRKKENGVEIIIWNVSATLNQNLAYTRYPFDVKDLTIQLWHTDFEKNITLIPDLDSYQLINPRSLPGINPNAYLSGWHMQESYFGFRKNDYNTIFGIYSYGPFGIYKHVEKSNKPELYFTILAKRNLEDTLFADLLPLCVIALLLFVILLTSVMQSYAAILGSCASVFFGIVFAQTRFRVKIPSYQLVYFESFYFVMYAVILAIVIVAVLYHLKFNIRAIQYRNNMIAKLLYWAIVLCILLIITLIYLY